jgi:hypothetical protein
MLIEQSEFRHVTCETTGANTLSESIRPANEAGCCDEGNSGKEKQYFLPFFHLLSLHNATAQRALSAIRCSRLLAAIRC